jgi:hypothetical protein
MFSKVFDGHMQAYTFSKKLMTSYDELGISRCMMVYDRHMSVFDEDSALILVMDTVVLSTRPVPLLF